MHTQSSPQKAQQRRSISAGISAAPKALRHISNFFARAGKRNATRALTENNLPPRDVRQVSPDAKPPRPVSTLDPSNSPGLASVPRKKSTGAAPGGHVRQSSLSGSTSERLHPELLESQPLSNSNSRLPPYQAAEASSETDEASNTDLSASSSESSSVDDWDPEEAQRQKRLAQEAALELPAKQLGLLKAFEGAVGLLRAQLDDLYVDFSRHAPSSEQTALYQAFASVLDKLESLKPAFADAIPRFMAARATVRELSARITDFEERVDAQCTPRRRQLEKSLATAAQGAATRAIQVELDQLAKVFNDMREHKAFRKAALAHVPHAGPRFLEPAPDQTVEPRPAVNWASMKLRMERMASGDLSFDAGLAAVRQALHEELDDVDLEDALLTLVWKFCAACQHALTEIPLLQDLIAQSTQDPAKAKLLSVLQEGLTLNLQCESAADKQRALSLQAPLDHISVLLAMLQAEPEGARMFGEIAHRHQVTRSRRVDSDRMELLFVMEAVGMEANGARVSSLVRFTRMVAAYGERLLKCGLPRSKGAKTAQEFMALLQKAGVN